MVFHWSLSDSKSPQVSSTLLSILVVINNAVVWMVSIRPTTSESSSPYKNPLVTVPKAPITIGIIVTCMFHIFFPFHSKVEVLILLFTFFQFYSVVSRDSKVDNFAISLFLLLIIIRSGLLTEIRWSLCMSKSHRSLYVFFSRTGAGLCIYHLLVYYYYYYYYYYSLGSFSHQLMLMVSCWSLNDRKSQVCIPLMRFLLQSLISRYLVVQRFSFVIFSFISVGLIISASSNLKYL